MLICPSLSVTAMDVLLFKSLRIQFYVCIQYRRGFAEDDAS